MEENHTAFLKINGISKDYGVVKALKNVSFSIEKGEIHTILGENGAGKSTLVKILKGETAPSSGSIELDRQIIRAYTPSAAHAAGIHMVHQELAIFENLTVAENIYPNFKEKRAGRIDDKKQKELTQKQLALFDIQTITPDQPMASVTLGGQQMVEILRCIAAKPKVLILDEPTSGLNDNEADKLMRILKQLKAEGITVVYISHRLKEIMRISDRITVLRDGEYVTTIKNTDSLTENDLINCMVGRDLSESLYSRKEHSSADKSVVLLEVKELSKKKALNSTSLKLHKGEVVGVFGLEGSGMSKLSRMIYGLERRDSGDVYVKGRRVRKLNPRSMVDMRVMYLNNNRKQAGLLMDRSIAENVALPIMRRLSGFLGFIHIKKQNEIAREFVDRFSIALPSLYTTPKQLSGGNQQKVMLSACLAPEPEIMIVNEPTRGIDVGAKAEIHKFLLNIAGKGVGVLVFSSEIPELMTICDRIMVMRDNSIVGELVSKDFDEQPIMQFAAVGYKG
jgi:ABC-type sugar transport system ATPase subunit